jgi:hypothetical protein
MMEKERLEWVMSGLSHYHLTAMEDQFIKSVEQDFSHNKLTEEQEEKLESLYKEKSKLIPNRNYFSPKQSSPPTKTKAKRFRPKWIS